MEDKKSRKKITRRTFVKTTGAAYAFSIIPSYVRGGSGRRAPSDKLNIAGIGIGGQGGSNLTNAGDENVVALCDVDFSYAEKTVQKYPKAKKYSDYREMLDKEKEIDAIIIATPDHTHAVIALAAIQAGKHVYCQKPLTHDIYESRVLAKAAAASQVTTCMGIQGHSGEGIRLICEWIWDGAIGEIKEVDAWCSLSYYPWGHASWSSAWDHLPEEAMEKPEHIDWDLWLGPAAFRPYHRAYHPRTWRCWWDFGCGMMGDRGAHTLDSVFKSLKLGFPATIHASTLGGNDETHPLAATVSYTFPVRGDLPPLKLTWYEGLEPPWPAGLEPGRKLPNEGGVVFKGEKASIICGVYGDSPRIIPESAMMAYGGAEKTIPRVTGTHEEDWVRHCKDGTKPGACFEYAGPLTEMALLGNVAKRFPGNLLLWDGPNLQITNLSEANAWVRRPYREGWTLSDI